MQRPRSSAASRLLQALPVAAVLVAGALLGCLVPQAAHADDAESISGAPCGPDGQRDNRSRFSYEATPGQKVTDCFLVENTGQVTQHVTIYGTDAFNTEDGSYGLLAADATVTDAGSWVAFPDGGRPEFDLAPGESRALDFTLTVPDNAGPGDHPAGIIVSAQTPSDQILVERRVGTRLYVRVPGDLQSLVTISGMTAMYLPELNPFAGSTVVTLTLTNQGNVAMSPALVLGVRSLIGSDLVDRRLENINELLPGATRTMSFTLGPVGQYVYLTPYASVFPRDDISGMTTLAPPAPRVDRDVGVWAVPWLLVALIVAAVGVVFWVRWRRNRDDKRAAEWIAFTEAEARRRANAGGTPVAAGTGGASDA